MAADDVLKDVAVFTVHWGQQQHAGLFVQQLRKQGKHQRGRARRNRYVAGRHTTNFSDGFDEFLALRGRRFLTAPLQLFANDIKRLGTGRERAVEYIGHDEGISNVEIKPRRLPGLPAVVAGIVTGFILPVGLNFLGVRFQHGTDAHVHREVHRLTVLNPRLVEHLQPVALVELHHLGVPHGHDVGAAPLNHEFKGVAHQPERQVLAPVGRCHREASDLKSGVLGVSAGGKHRSLKHVA